MNTLLNRINKPFNRFFLICFLILCSGIPLAFSSITRSVFEVNKLLILRSIILIVYGAWIFKSLLLKDNKLEPKASQSYSIFGLKWRRIGLEIPILLWIIANFISVILSENIFLGYIGAYDRWEGISTILNYILLFYMVAKLIDNTKYRLLIFCILLFSTTLSSFYGILQSLEIDFMNWSTSPTSRVFACINNPVHFCAYVGMVTPIGISLSYYFLHRLSPHSLSAPAFSASLERFHIVFFSMVILFNIFYGLLAHLNFFPYLGIFTPSFFQWLSFVYIGGLILNRYTSLLPSKQNILECLSYCAVLGLFSFFDVYILTGFQTLFLIISLCCFFCFAALPNKQLFLYRLCVFCTIVVFYSMLLSFSRATIIGFVIGITLFFQLVLEKNHHIISLPKCITLFFAVFFTSFCLIFKLHHFGTVPILIEIILLLLTFCSFYYSSFPTIKKILWKDIWGYLLFYMLLIIPFIELPILRNFVPVYSLFLLLAVPLFIQKLNTSFIKNILCLCIVLNLSFYFSSIFEILFFIVLLYLFYYHYLQENAETKVTFHVNFLFISMAIVTLVPLSIILSKEIIQSFTTLATFHSTLNLLSFFILVGVVFKRHVKSYIAGSILLVFIFLGIQASSYYISPSLTSTKGPIIQSDGLIVARTITGRMKNLTSNKARLFMWASVPPWFLDAPLFGTGPDTIRFLYPRYRHPKYGIHEGGHNFTPDRLHNEYFNTLVTNGLIGLILKYVLFFGTWYVILIKLLKRYVHSHKRFFLIGIICSPMIYLVQTIFNFGVVATLFLFYFVLGLGLSFVNDEYH
ncbi:hypothetical protein DID78_05115 [Candidatus Marinamargulisbacteria bacterium SCGC AG-343-D04]|nr:hypothetical protein DID78_05115 [Candidatus Marinamargulisbacteria bacterium SCGC AG-343-D04]